MNNLEGFKQMTELEIKSHNYLTKGDIAKKCIPEDVTFDYALPQEWLDSFMELVGLTVNYSYNFVLATTFMLYSDERGFRQGIPWSACVEVDQKIKAHTGREDENPPNYMTMQNALEIVLELARDNMLTEEFGDDERLIKEAERQQTAINVVEDYFVNHFGN